MTNREKQMQIIQSKTDEELATMIYNSSLHCSECPAYAYCEPYDDDCEITLVHWLNEEADE